MRDGVGGGCAEVGLGVTGDRYSRCCGDRPRDVGVQERRVTHGSVLGPQLPYPDRCSDRSTRYPHRGGGYGRDGVGTEPSQVQVGREISNRSWEFY